MDNAIKRREFVKAAGMAALGVTTSSAAISAPLLAQAQLESARGAALEFPRGFYCGQT
jgi:hypothetical protein